MLVDGVRCDQVFLAELGFDQAALQVALSAISLNASGCAGKTSARIALQSLVDRQLEFAVVACRDGSRRVVGHKHNDNSASFHASPVIPKNEGEGA